MLELYVPSTTLTSIAIILTYERALNLTPLGIALEVRGEDLGGILLFPLLLGLYGTVNCCIFLAAISISIIDPSDMIVVEKN